MKNFLKTNWFKIVVVSLLSVTAIASAYHFVAKPNLEKPVTVTVADSQTSTVPTTPVAPQDPAPVAIPKKPTPTKTVSPQKNAEEFDANAYKAQLDKEYQEERDALVASGTKAGNFCKDNPTWTIGECNQASWGDVWIGMDSDMLRASRGYPDSTSPSNYGDGETTQKCWDDKTPMCVYLDSNGIVTAYN